MKIIDMHCDTLDRLLSLQEAGKPEGLRQNSGHLDLQRMQESGYLLQNFAMFVMLREGQDPWERVCSLYECYQTELERNRDILAPVLLFEDIAKNQAAGKLSALLTVEEGAVCKGEIEKLRRLYEMGVRMMTLTWNFENEIGYPNFIPEYKTEMMKLRAEWKQAVEECEKVEQGYAAMRGQKPEWTNDTDLIPADAKIARIRCEEKRQVAQAAFHRYFHIPNIQDGLTERGREFVAEMECLGMIPDVSHLSDAGFYDVLAVTKKPFVASHSNARAVSPAVRNMTDDMIRKLAERGGCMGLNYCADFLEETPLGVHNPGTIDAIVRHAKHIVNVGGIEVLGLGSDFDGIDTHEELPGAQAMGLLWEALRKGGFSEGALDKIFCGNVLRVYRETL